MAKKYYLMNGKNGVGNAVNLLIDNKIVREFNDIAELDFRTLGVPYEKASQILKEFNSTTDLTGMFYDVQYPYKKVEVKSFATMFKYDNEKTKNIEEKFRYFTEERMNYKLKGNNLKLCEGDKLDEYIKLILSDVLSEYSPSILAYNSIMSASLKELLSKRYTIYSKYTTYEFMNANIYRLRCQLSSYIELRNLTIEYLLWIQGLNTGIRTIVKNKEKYNNNGMYYIAPLSIDKKESIIEYEQMELSDFMDIPKIKKLK